MTPTEEKIARDLLTIGAVFLRPEEPFIWASGIKSPVYCDNRLTLTAPEVRNDVEQALAETVRREYPEAELLMGTSTAGSRMRRSRRICCICRWGMCAREPRTTAGATGLRGNCFRGRRRW